MNRTHLFIVIFSLIFTSIDGKKYHLFGAEDSSSNLSISKHRLLIDIDIYNRPYVLPYFLGQLEKFQCPCGECYLDFRLYHVFNTSVEDETSRLIKEWVEAMKKSSKTPFSHFTIHQWSAKSTEDRANRLGDVMKRVAELNVNYLAMFDSMVIFLEPASLLSILISKDKPLMTPLLRSTKDMFTSTFYLNDQESSGYHAYKEIYERKKVGCFLIDGGIKDVYFFNFHYSQLKDVFLNNDNFFPVDVVARQNAVPMYVCNREMFGYIPGQYIDGIYDEKLIEQSYLHMLIEHQLTGPSQTYLAPIARSSLIEFPRTQSPTKFGFDEIFIINLARRTDRRERLKSTFDILNMEVRFVDAVDGKFEVDQKYLENLNVRLLPNYEDPYNLRPINYGELGCFFSHYFIWKEMIEKNYENGALILEDDPRFDVYFKAKLEKVFSNRTFDWDLIYLGRKIMRPDEENYDDIIENYLIQPLYSHWTVGYALSLRGAKILVNENPLQKILPVDEYLPIMFDRHPNESWKKHFQNRVLKAYAFYPSILTPTHYFGEPNYISDTENTTILVEKQEKVLKASKIVSVDVVTEAAPIEKSEL